MEEVNSENMVSVKVKVEEEEVLNPEYEKMIESHGNDQTKWPFQPDKTIKKSKYEIIKYKKAKLQKRAFGDLAIRIFDALSRKLVFSYNFEDTLEKSDTYQEPVEKPGILYDPLEMLSDTEIKSELRGKRFRIFQVLS